ncbi:DUF4350 domain-containing protein [Natronomonas halophila]|uniref:DUF4350 domain-containing protein n=1 Tax=Natronomonas halophila TaxID=2747817 RepID=UPI0015B3F803|nr:DUF4350 domain-containing protein [Natronomonas halophila]QLD87045.1 DUF4350 domain-containing protein [Natronomonas halophila]
MKTDAPQAALAALVLAVVVVLLVGGATSGVAFGSFNPQWDGTSDLRTTAEQTGSEPTVMQNTTEYVAYGSDDIAFVLAPSREYDRTHTNRIRGFLERGGTLVVADRDGPHGSTLLNRVGADARPNGNGTVLRDERNYHRSPALPVATPVENASIIAGVESVTLNHGTAVEPNGATPVVTTSEFAYLDSDGNESLSENESLASYPVVTTESVGDGRVIVVGDPSIFINVMQDDLGNRAFVEALVDDTNHTIVDVSHGSSPPPLVAALLAIRDSVLLQIGLGLGGLAIVGLIGRIVGRREPAENAAEADPHALSEGLNRLYEDVDRDRLERVTKGIIRTRVEPDDDE